MPPATVPKQQTGHIKSTIKLKVFQFLNFTFRLTLPFLSHFNKSKDGHEQSPFHTSPSRSTARFRDIWKCRFWQEPDTWRHHGGATARLALGQLVRIMVIFFNQYTYFFLLTNKVTAQRGVHVFSFLTVPLTLSSFSSPYAIMCIRLSGMKLHPIAWY